MHRSAQPPETATGNQALDEILEEITGKLQAGEAISVEDYSRDQPELAEKLRKLLPGMRMLADLGHVPHGTSSSSATDSSDSQRLKLGILGDFRILQEIGRGGMGVVYEAEQISIGRRVALKVLPFAAMLDKQQINRFKNEARAAGTLDHPNIVAVHSVGTERGVHYYAMQFVEGRSLAEVIAELRTTSVATVDKVDRPSEAAVSPSGDTKRDVQAALSTVPEFDTQEYFRSVAQLGIQAAEALDDAHQNGIVHRDVKPGNLLVDVQGKLWVTDFGLARIEADAGMTMTGDLLGTLRYMSPEQAGAERGVLDHRTDIYSLGVTLYELLTLQPAFPISNMGTVALSEGDSPLFVPPDRQRILHDILEKEPCPPRQINRAIPKDLETIVLKAISKEPHARYTTVQDLAEDLKRYLEDKPIQAKRPTPVQRAAKWSYRHKGWVASAAAALFIAVMGLAVSTVLVWREKAQTELQRAEAERATNEAQAVVRFLVNDLIGSTAPQKALGRRVTVEEVLGNAEDKIESAFENQPRIEAAVRHTMGLTYHDLGKYAAAERHFARARQLRTRLLGAEHPATLASMSRLADVFRHQGKLDEARKLHEQTLQARRRVLGEEDPDTLASMHHLAMVLKDQDNLDAARKLYEQTLRVERRVLGAEHPDTLASMSNLANVLCDQGKLDAARRLCEQTLAIYHRILGAEHPVTLRSMNNLADMLKDQGKLDAARKLSEPALQACCRVLGEEHPDTLKSMQTLANVLRRQGKLDQAQAHYQTAVDVREKLRTQNPADIENAVSLARLCRILGDLLVDRRQAEAGLDWYTKAIGILTEPLEQVAGQPLARVVLLDCFRARGPLLQRLGRAREASADYVKYLELMPDSPDRNNELAWELADCLDVRLRDPQRAVALATQAVQRAPDPKDYWHTLGLAHYRAGNFSETIEALEKSIDALSGGDYFEFLFLAMAHWQLGNPGANDQGTAERGPSGVSTGKLADQEQGWHRNQARQWYEKAVQWIEKNVEAFENGSRRDDMRRWRAEAEKLMRIKEAAETRR